jgi:hypothetical protein
MPCNIMIHFTGNVRKIIPYTSAVGKQGIIFHMWCAKKKNDAWNTTYLSIFTQKNKFTEEILNGQCIFGFGTFQESEIIQGKVQLIIHAMQIQMITEKWFFDPPEAITNKRADHHDDKACYVKYENKIEPKPIPIEDELPF